MRKLCLPLLLLLLLINIGLIAQVKKVGHSRQAGSGYKSSAKSSAAHSATSNKTANTNVQDPGNDGGGFGGSDCVNFPAITISSGTATVCQGENSTTTFLSTGTTAGVLQWLSSSDNVNFTVIPNANGASYTAVNLSQTTYFVLEVQYQCTKWSNHITVTVTPSHWYKDFDGDGYSDGASLTQCDRPDNYKLPSELTTISGDCNDNNGNVWNGAFWYIDEDGDQYTAGQEFICYGDFLPPGYSSISKGADCDDSNPLVWFPTVAYIDKDGDGYDNGTGPACFGLTGGISPGFSFGTNGSDCDDDDPAVHGQSIFYLDSDEDGYGDPDVTISGCTTPDGYVVNNSDCDDSDKTIYPGAPELCDGKDNNCNGQTDEGVSTITYYRDGDGDGYGNAAITTEECSKPSGYVTNNTDCNDSDETIYPGAPESCDGKDNNCNGQTDEGVSNITYYRDVDGDGFGNPGLTTQSCSKPAGYVSNNTDCNDGNTGIYPGAAEICNGIDDNCNGQIDEGVTNTTYYRDADGDGFGNPGVTKQSCTKPTGYVTNNSDCNDSKPGIYPGAPEICNGIDDNCNGQIDEAAANTIYYRDADGDGFGNPGVTTLSCTKPRGYVTNNADCNDNKAGIYPGAPEICNGIDDNCNGLVDELEITNLTTTKITSTSAKLNWTSSSSPTGFQVNYKKSSSATWQTVAVSGSSRSVTISSLSRNQDYNWRIRALCGKTLTNYSATLTFKTLGSTTRSRPGATDEGDIMEIAKQIQINAWPNPTRTNFVIMFTNNDQKTTTKMIVTDLYGRIIEQRILNNEQVIRLGDKYKAGVYVVKLIRGEDVEQLKLIKLE